MSLIYLCSTGMSNSQTRDYFAHTGTIQYRVSTRVSITATRVTTL
eukprot:COSAG01_NODE_18720_length_1057_cov_167.760960_3_plen_44_part_01